MNSHNLSQTLLALLPLAFFTAPVFAAIEVHGDTGAAVVSLGDLNLSTADGRTTAQERLQQTARRLCGKLSMQSDRSRHENYLACVDDAVTHAMERLDQAALKPMIPR